VVSSIFGVIILAVIGVTVYLVHSPPTEERFTEFYILGIEGKAEGYPSKLAVGEEGKVLLGIENHEWEEMNYRVEVRVAAKENNELGPIVLTHEQKWLEEVSFILHKIGENQKVEFLLFKEGENEPYSSLHLLVDIITPS